MGELAWSGIDRSRARAILAQNYKPKRDFARKMGVDITVNAKEEDVAAVISRETLGRGADVVIVAASSPDATADAVNQAAISGRIAWFAGLLKDRAAVTVDANRVHYRELPITGTTACSSSDCQRAAEIVVSGRIGVAPVIARRVALVEIATEFNPAATKDGMKTVVTGFGGIGPI